MKKKKKREEEEGEEAVEKEHIKNESNKNKIKHTKTNQVRLYFPPECTCPPADDTGN